MRHFLRDLGRFLILIGTCIICLQTCQCGPVINIEDRIYQPKVLYRNVYISEDFTSIQVQDITDALNEWQEKTHGAVQFHIENRFNQHFDTLLALHDKSLVFLDCSYEMTPKIKELDDELHKTDDEGFFTLIQGYYDDRSIPTICIVSEDIASRVAFTSVVEHEVGHALGLSHNPKEGTVMYWKQNEAAKHLTSDDVAAFCRIHYCDPSIKIE